MNHYNEFLNTNIEDHKELNKKFKNAAIAIYSKENNKDFYDILFSGDNEINQEINSGSINPYMKSSTQIISEHIINVTENWQKKGCATLFRGTRLCDDSSSFKLNGVHATPQIDIALAYGNGSVNTTTGIGQIFSKVGFLNSYQVPLDQKTYKSFEYEDIIKYNEHDSNKTLKLFVEQVSQLAQQSHLFKREGDFYSEGEKILSQLMKDNYESILQNNNKSEKFIVIDQKLLKIDLNNEEWQQLLARHQEICLRHFYEIAPLEYLLEKIEKLNEKNNCLLKKDKETTELYNNIQEEIVKELECRKNAPWEAKKIDDIKLNDSPYIKQRAYINESHKVGASNGSEINYPESIKKLQLICECLEFNNYSEAIIKTAEYKSINNMIELKSSPRYLTLPKKFDSENIVSIRNKYSSTNPNELSTNNIKI